MSIESIESTDSLTLALLRFFAGLAGLAGLGMFVVHIVGFELLPFESGARFPLGYLLGYYLVSGAGAVGMIVLMGMTVGVVVVGISMTLYENTKQVILALIRAARYVHAHTLDQLIGKTLPWAICVPAVIGFCYLTGGPAAFWYWLLVSFPAAFVHGLGMWLWDTLRRWLPASGSGLVVLGLHAWMGINVFAFFADSAPAGLPVTGSGLGPYVAMWLGVGVMFGSWTVGTRARDLLIPPEAPTPAAPTTVPTDTPGAIVGLEEFWSPVPVEGWRAWAWKGGALHGYWTPWPTSVFRATCEVCPEIPGEQHGCGIYAVKVSGQVDGAFFRHHGLADVVVGRVALEGLVIEHETGYRAERARILELFAPQHLLSEVAGCYPDVAVSPLTLGE